MICIFSGVLILTWGSVWPIRNGEKTTQWRPSTRFLHEWLVCMATCSWSMSLHLCPARQYDITTVCNLTCIFTVCPLSTDSYTVAVLQGQICVSNNSSLSGPECNAAPSKPPSPTDGRYGTQVKNHTLLPFVCRHITFSSSWRFSCWEKAFWETRQNIKQTKRSALWLYFTFNSINCRGLLLKGV